MGAGVLVVSLKKGDSRQLILRSDNYADDRCELRPARGRAGRSDLDAFMALIAGDGRVIGVTDLPPNMSGDVIDVALEEAPLRAAMLRLSRSTSSSCRLFLSLIVAGLVFLALNQVLVKPMRRLTANMLAFGTKPEDTSRIIAPSRRADEIGVAERELHAMQTELVIAAQQKIASGRARPRGEQGEPRSAQHALLGASHLRPA